MFEMTLQDLMTIGAAGLFIAYLFIRSGRGLVDFLGG